MPIGWNPCADWSRRSERERPRICHSLVMLLEHAGEPDTIFNIYVDRQYERKAVQSAPVDLQPRQLDPRGTTQP